MILIKSINVASERSYEVLERPKWPAFGKVSDLLVGPVTSERRWAQRLSGFIGNYAKTLKYAHRPIDLRPAIRPSGALYVQEDPSMFRKTRAFWAALFVLCVHLHRDCPGLLARGRSPRNSRPGGQHPFNRNCCYVWCTRVCYAVFV